MSLAGFDNAVTKSDLELLISSFLLPALGLELRASDCWVSIDQLSSIPGFAVRG